MRYPPLILSLATVAALFGLVACSRDVPRSSDRIYALGERAEVGHLTYMAYETQWLPQIGEGAAARVPQHRFFEVRVSAANNGAAETIVPNATLVDDSGNTYDELSAGDGVPAWLGFVRRAQAGETLQGLILFDAPPQHYKLRVTDESADLSATIDIPLSFSSAPLSVPGTDLSR
jgi:hypothetical protein